MFCRDNDREPDESGFWGNKEPEGVKFGAIEVGRVAPGTPEQAVFNCERSASDIKMVSTTRAIRAAVV